MPTIITHPPVNMPIIDAEQFGENAESLGSAGTLSADLASIASTETLTNITSTHSSLIFGSGNDFINAESGNHIIISNGNADSFNLLQTSGNEAVFLNGDGANILLSTSGNDIIDGSGSGENSFDTIVTVKGDNLIIGGSYDNQIVTESGHNVIFGNGTDVNVIDPGNANDVITGGPGTNEYDMSGVGNDVITNFTLGTDLLNFNAGQTDFNLQNEGNSTVITYESASGTEGALTLLNVTGVTASELGLA